MYWVSLKSDYEKLTGTDFKSVPTEFDGENQAESTIVIYTIIAT